MLNPFHVFFKLNLQIFSPRTIERQPFLRYYANKILLFHPRWIEFKWARGILPYLAYLHGK
jgi:hypothetical protein